MKGPENSPDFAIETCCTMITDAYRSVLERMREVVLDVHGGAILAEVGGSFALC